MVSPQLQRRTGGYESDQSSDTAAEDDFSGFPVPNSMPPAWQSQRQQSGGSVSRLSQKFGFNGPVAEIPPPAPLRTQRVHQEESTASEMDDDVHSRSSTLGGSDQDFDFPEKTPTSLPKQIRQEIIKVDSFPEDGEPKSHVPGPLETQLASLMSKLIFMERENPTVSITPEDHAATMAELEALREEKKSWKKRYESIYALRDEDVENNIKIRGMLAKARRDLEGMTKLREDDLANLQIVRARLAESTRKLDRLETQTGSGNGRSSPSRGARPPSVFMERRNTTDLFAAAQAAALQQRALELESRNADLQSQIESLKGGASIDDLNRLTAHKAWKDTVTDLETRVKAKDAEIARLRSSGGGSHSQGEGNMGTTTDWRRIEAIHEEHASYREKVGGKMQALRSEKETLQRELHRREDECHALEVKVQSLQRRLSVI
ncbi:hypothetical protein BU24DRAFT_417243 [Aaosphaeria arxii CBS 175.79]|uniref:Uncharacterized protein n=1 Tax=Aaosphaeria arxii CBS 175.79 TaxID=1450172 RepID=A0A6A5Y8R5_9PLEO|nr:uncharacterized protein BU24DRAFT_417243 [Aaosphaeria arxii CBS 175.79]KAF2021613.1 hypothetical protein BU24DRAFT_417243 [Aaosphaeria arxii CBS 175.79]